MEELLPYLILGLLVGFGYAYWKEKKGKKK
jgi:predicted negative regulator of RcsB-dependent stress response